MPPVILITGASRGISRATVLAAPPHVVIDELMRHPLSQEW